MTRAIGKNAGMRRSNVFLLGVFCVCLMPLTPRAVEIDSVPHPKHKGTVFRWLEGKPPSAMAHLVSTGDGARTILGENIMITGSKGAVLGFSHGSDVFLLQGDILVHAGSSPGRILLGENSITFNQAVVLIISRSKGWLIKVLSAAPYGGVNFEPTHRQLDQNIVYRAADEGTLIGDRSFNAEVVCGAMQRLLWPVEEPRLVVVDVETPSDRRITPPGEHAERQVEIDIEPIDIEIETDCIEICLD